MIAITRNKASTNLGIDAAPTTKSADAKIKSLKLRDKAYKVADRDGLHDAGTPAS